MQLQNLFDKIKLLLIQQTSDKKSTSKKLRIRTKIYRNSTLSDDAISGISLLEILLRRFFRVLNVLDGPCRDKKTTQDPDGKLNRPIRRMPSPHS